MFAGEGIALWWHGHLGVELLDDLDEETLLRLVRHDRGEAGVAALQHGGALIETKLRFLLIGTVALDTAVFKDWEDVFCEVGGG